MTIFPKKKHDCSIFFLLLESPSQYTTLGPLSIDNCPPEVSTCDSMYFNVIQQAVGAEHDAVKNLSSGQKWMGGGQVTALDIVTFGVGVVISRVLGSQSGSIWHKNPSEIRLVPASMPSFTTCPLDTLILTDRRTDTISFYQTLNLLFKTENRINNRKPDDLVRVPKSFCYKIPNFLLKNPLKFPYFRQGKQPKFSISKFSIQV